MADVTQMIPAAQLNNQPPKFQSSVADFKPPTADEEAAMRQMFEGKTFENLNDTVPTPAQSGQPAQVPVVLQQQPAPTPKVDVPAKFLKPDGTVDEEKLKTSSEQLGSAIQEKKKSIEEMVAEYKEQEKQFTELGQKAKQLKETPPNPTPEIPTIMGQNLPPEQIRQQLLALQQSDPIAFAVEIARAVAVKEAREVALPALQMTEHMAEQQRDHQMRQNLLSLAESDPRIQDPGLYAEFVNELKADPGYYRTKNPQKNAWNAVKERLRLGEPQGSAHPSQPSSPTLGRGAPPPVSSFSQPLTPQNAQERMTSINPFSQEGKEMEAALLRSLAETTWRG